MFHIHKWTKWKLRSMQGKTVFRSHVIPCVINYQMRECKKCGKTQARAIDL